MRANSGKTPNHGTLYPPSEYIKVCDLDIPRWIIYLVNFILALMLFVILHRLSPFSDFVLAVIVFVVISRINIHLHEKCHQIIFEALTGKPAVVCKNLITPNCRPTVPCPVPAYLAAQIFPLITSAGLGAITSILYIFNTPPWIIFGFTLATISSFLGSSGDLYWAFKLRNFPNDCLVIDHGTSAEVYAPPGK
ncbi:MAG: metalloprotease family protein [Syntrophaceticus sp.]|nr:metalloprotease family protein [Syntrophaceticus sp.]MDD4360174.1 metalloprotease family protein [Syntrophaceticus sp.]MDD4782711.1 metalloprotease family protein [Syntrophaceticus sp.]